VISRSFLKDPPGVGQVPNEPKNLGDWSVMACLPKL